MTDINLHTIFCHLTGDDNFLSIVIETDNDNNKKKKNKKKKFNLMETMVTEYKPLAPYEVQNYIMFPHKVKLFLTPDYIRYGIKNVMEKDTGIVNISFLNSLNMLIRPDIYKLNIEDHFRNFNLLEGFICHKIERNFQIDKTKRTKKIQAINKELIKNLLEGKISHELIQSIINIFEINLLIFDLTKMDIYFYWTRGTKYPYINLFKNVYCMAYVQGNYEPIMTDNNTIPEEQKRKIYIQIFRNISDIKCFPNISLALHTLVYINSWDIDLTTFIKIIEIFSNEGSKKSISDLYNDLIKLEKKF